MWADIRFAVRQLRKSPGYAITTILTLAIGIGANTAIFSLMDAVVLRPLAVPDIKNVVTLEEQKPGSDGTYVALANYEDWAAQSRSFEDLAVRTFADMSMAGPEGALHVNASEISPNLFTVLHAEPLLGRLFRADEATSGRDAETVLSYGFWQRQFGRNAQILGQKVELNGRSYTVVGVMPRNLAYPSAAEIFVPLATSPEQRLNRTGHDYQVVGRLRSGVSVDEARADLKGIAARLANSYPATNKEWSVKVTPLLEAVNGTLTPMYFKFIMGATGFVLLIVCANIANLQFARGLGRRNEMALRTALGARRYRLLRQLLMESVLVGVAAAAAGLLLAKFDLQLAIYSMPIRVAQYIAGWGHISLNGRALALSIFLAVASGVVSGIAPSLEALRVNLVEQLKSGSRTATGSIRTHRLRNIFAVCQIALAVALVVGAALMAKGMWNMLHAADVYGPKHVLTFNVQLPHDRYDTPQKLAAWYDESLSRLRALPGVKQVAITPTMPAGQDDPWHDDFRIENRAVNSADLPAAARLSVSNGYFDALHISILQGRGFTAADGLNAPAVAIVSRKFAAQYFPGSNAIGHRIQMGAARHSNDPWMTIVGIADDVTYNWTAGAPEPAIYMSAGQIPVNGTAYVVVTDGNPVALASQVRKALGSIDPSLPLDAMQSYEGFLREALTGLIYVASMLSIDAFIALLLAAIGIFGVMANLVGERRREIGLRLTLGARREDVTRMFLQRAGVLTLIGLGAGLGMAIALARMVSSLFYGVRPGDLTVFATVSVAIVGISLISSWLPVRAASSVEPVEALRDE